MTKKQKKTGATWKKGSAVVREKAATESIQVLMLYLCFSYALLHALYCTRRQFSGGGEGERKRMLDLLYLRFTVDLLALYTARTLLHAQTALE